MTSFFGIIRKELPLVMGSIILLSMGINCTSDDPRLRTFTLSIIDRQLESEGSRLKVNQYDDVKIVVHSDQNVGFHLHGYDIEIMIKAGEPTNFNFLANATGSFPFTIHVDETSSGHMHANHQEDLMTSKGEIKLGHLDVFPN